jgi:ABC-2 type transport system permease protein
MKFTGNYILTDLKGAWAIAKKDLFIYYLKPNIFMSGILFPLFMLLAFAVGRDAPIVMLIPGLVAITALFSASSIEPVSIPIERRTKTFDRLISAPISFFSIVLGESLSGFLFSFIIGMLIVLGGLTVLHPSILSFIYLLFALAFSCFCFASMGTVFAAYPTENVGEVMSLLNLVRLPLIFISGVFIPLETLPSWGRVIALFSPLTYANDAIVSGFGGTGYFGLALDLFVLIIFITIFQVMGYVLYKKYNQ